MKYTVYKTTHLPTGRFYIGRHVTEDVNDKYLGSGTVISRVLASHPKSEFQKQVLETFDNPDEMIKAEELYIRQHWGSKLLLNLVIGDPFYTGWLDVSQATRDKISKKHKGKTISAEQRAKISQANLGSKRSEETKAKMRANHKGTLGMKHSAETIAKYIIDRRGKCSGDKNGFYGKEHSEETRKLWSEKRKRLRWVNDGKSSKMVDESLVAQMINEGWITGRLR